MGSWKIVGIVVTVVLGLGSSTARAQATQFLVAGHDGALPSAADVAAAGGTWVGEIPSIGVAIVRSDAPGFLAAVKKRRSVALASHDVELTIPDAAASGGEELSSSLEESTLSSVVSTPDPFAVLEWDDVVLGTKAAHDRLITGDKVTIAVVDSGIDKTHPDLVHAVIPEGKSFVPGDANPFPTTGAPTTQGHGTAVSGIIAAACNNGVGVCGVAPGAKLLSVRVSDGNSTPMSTLLQGYDWASTEGVSRHHVRIISSSHAYFCFDTDAACQVRLIDAMGIGNRMVAAVYRRGVVLIVAAGNGDASGIAYDVSAQGDSFKLWPGGNKALTVGSTGPCCAGCDGDPMNDHDYDDPAIYSNFGFSELESSFMVMPGGQRNACPKPAQCKVTTFGTAGLIRNCGQFDMVWTTSLFSTLAGVTQNRYFAFSGTSAAVPQAAGLAALVLSRFPELEPGQLKDMMLRDLTVDLGPAGYDPLYGHGRGSAALIP
jgi:subtilisin family serine protease